jgi:hypothetical protein
MRASRTVKLAALWLCGCNVLAVVVAAQCTSVTQAPNINVTSDLTCYQSTSTLTAAAGVAVSGAGSVVLVAGQWIDLRPTVVANANGATVPTTFHAWVDTVPSAVSVWPSIGSGMTQPFTWTASSPSGWAHLNDLQAIIGRQLSGNGSCYIGYDVGPRILKLANENGIGWGSSAVLGAQATMSNSYCSINVGQSGVAYPDGNTVALTVSVTFQPSFSGAMNTYLDADDAGMGLSSGWQQMGTWTVPSGTLESITVSVPSGLTFTADGNTYTSQQTFQWAPGSQHTIGVATVQSGGTGVRYTFSAWSDGGAATHPITVPSSSAAYSATFTTYYFLSTGAYPTGGGSISPLSGWYNSGAGVWVSANPSSGYQFSGFTGALSGTTSPQWLIMNGARNVTANFAPVTTVTINPALPNVVPGGTQLFRALVMGLDNPNVTWFVASGPGTITTSGLYSVPSNVLPGTVVGIRAQAADGTTNQVQFGIIAATLAAFTITTSPPGLSMVVDGVPCTSPCTYQWNTGTQHMVATTAVQSVAGTQYLFSQWSDCAPLSHTIQNVGTDVTTYTATFNARIPISSSKGIATSHLEVNLGPLPIDLYDGSALDRVLSCDPVTGCFPGCSADKAVTQAHMQYLLSNYAIQGVTGVRFQFATRTFPSSAFDTSGNVQQSWVGHLANFFEDLKTFGITNVTPTPVWDDFTGAERQDYADKSLLGQACRPYPDTPGCPTLGQCPTPCDPNASSCTGPCPRLGSWCQTGSPLKLGKYLGFSPLLPYGADPNDQYNVDGSRDLGNNAYFCSPFNPGFWGWTKAFNVIDSIGCAAATPSACAALPSSCTAPGIVGCTNPDTGGLRIEEFDLENEVNLVDNTVQGRLIYDNTTGTPVFSYLGGALAKHGYTARVLTVSVNTPRPGDVSTLGPPLHPLYPCGSVYGDAAQVLPSSELIAAIGGGKIGTPSGYTLNGEMYCDGTPDTMISMPSQDAIPLITDMHAKPCLMGAGCDLSADATVPARDIFSMVWDFLYYRNLMGNIVIFGETSSSSVLSCNNDWDGPNPPVSPPNAPGITQEEVDGYRQSCLFGNTSCFVNGATVQAGVNPNPGNVVFRPWANAGASRKECESPLNIGAPNGPFKQQQ